MDVDDDWPDDWRGVSNDEEEAFDAALHDGGESPVQAACAVNQAPACAGPPLPPLADHDGVAGAPDCARVVLHFDVDAFYAQCEELRDPSLRDKPMAVTQKCVRSTRCVRALPRAHSAPHATGTCA